MRTVMSLWRSAARLAGVAACAGFALNAWAADVKPVAMTEDEVFAQMEAYKQSLAEASMKNARPMDLRGTPANDFCENAEVVTLTSGGFASVFGNNAFATDDPGLPACTLSTSAASGRLGVWYRVVGTGNAITISGCAQSLDLTLRVFCGGCPSLVCVASDDDGCLSPNSLAPRLTFCTQAGQEYLVLLSRFGTGAGGAFQLDFSDNGSACTATVSCTGAMAANAFCENALPVTVGSSVTGTTVDGAVPAGPACGGTITTPGVWYRFTGNGRDVRVTTCNPLTGSNTRVAVYNGSCGSLVCSVGATTSSPLCGVRDDAATTAVFCAVPGTEYFVFVGAFSNGAGLFELRIEDVGPGACIPRGACCLPGGCEFLTQAECATAGGNYLGDGTSCASAVNNDVVPIPDNTTAGGPGIASTSVTISESGTVQNLRVGIIIQHTFQGDLIVELSNGFSTATLLQRPGQLTGVSTFGYANDNFGNPTTGTPMFFSDAAANPYSRDFLGGAGVDNPVGEWLPITPLSVFNGQPVAGTWTLTVSDNAGGDTGSIRSFQLFIAGVDGCPDAPECPADFNNDDVVNTADITAFLSAWFAARAGGPVGGADFNDDGVVNTADITAFLSAWFQARAEGC